MRKKVLLKDGTIKEVDCRISKAVLTDDERIIEIVDKLKRDWMNTKLCYEQAMNVALIANDTNKLLFAENENAEKKIEKLNADIKELKRRRVRK